jgi:hypothetical protein
MYDVCTSLIESWKRLNDFIIGSNDEDAAIAIVSYHFWVWD